MPIAMTIVRASTISTIEASSTAMTKAQAAASIECLLE
jgi:hypothetical protein